MIDGNEVKNLLNDRALDFCSWLFPMGRRDGHNFKVGDLQGNGGNSLVISIQGEKVGLWKDWSTGEGGSNLLELFIQARGLNFKEAFAEAKSWLGVYEPTGLVRRRPEGTQPAKTGSKALTYTEAVEGGPVWNWLVNERGIRPEAVRAYRIGEARFPMKDKLRDFVIFPFFDTDGKLVRLKYRDICEKAVMFQKPKLSEAHEFQHGYQKLLFGWQAVNPAATTVGLCEGEIDAMTLWGWGALPCLSLPEGAQAKNDARPESESPHDQWLTHDHDALSMFTDIVLALDGDDPGRNAAEQIIPRLGRHRVRQVVWPEGVKDANDAHAAGHKLDLLVCAAKALDPDELRKPSDYSRDIWWEFYPEQNPNGGMGDPIPWNLPFMFRPGEFIVWHGYNGHGKTMVLNHCMTHLASLNRRICIASFEIPARKTFKNIARQAIGVPRPGTEARHEHVINWLDRSFWVYDKVGTASSVDVVDTFEYVFRKYGVTHFVIDSLMMLNDVGREDYEAQREVCNRCKAFAHENRVTLHLVCHSKKPDSKRPAEKKCPLKYDIAGSADIPNIADSVIAVWRNEEKEMWLQNGYQELELGNRSSAEAIFDEWRVRHDGQFQVQKQRETGEEPGRMLWFDMGKEGSWQYTARQGERPTIYCSLEGK
jgi:twinkle protein